MTLRFTVLGTPAPQGSKKGYVVNGRAVIVEDSKRTKPWRQDVQAAALAAIGDRPPLEGPLEVTVVFRMPRPGYHFRTGQHAGELKPGAPAYVDKKPDVDKLVRALLDSLTKVVWRDDAQVAVLVVGKEYATAPARPGADITVTPVAAQMGGHYGADGDGTVQEALL
jgi:Holliday junction resolvase RusA-like endonuclease